MVKTCGIQDEADDGQELKYHRFVFAALNLQEKKKLDPINHESEAAAVRAVTYHIVKVKIYESTNTILCSIQSADS